MRKALDSLTMRGRMTFAAGVAMATVAWVLGAHGLLSVAAFAIALPILAAYFVSRTRLRIRASRGVAVPRVSAGTATRSLVRLENASRLPSGTLLVHDTIPRDLGPSVRAVVNSLPPNGSIDLRADLVGLQRGQYTLGPTTLTLRDPFGMCELERTFNAVDRLMVTPRTVELPSIGLAGAWGGQGDSAARAIAVSGDDDVIPRNYHVGDELRRVNWRATAKTGDLMVRREEQPWHTSATIILDRRSVSHLGSGQDSTFEICVSLAASVAVHLQSHGLRVRVIDFSGTTLASGESEYDPEGMVLDALAVLELSAETDVAAGATLRRCVADSSVFAIASQLSPDHAQVLAAVRPPGTLAAAIVVDPAGWTTDESLSNSAAATTHTLRSFGWRVSTLEGHSVAARDSAMLAAWNGLTSALALLATGGATR
jgi:hypothetical protein